MKTKKSTRSSKSKVSKSAKPARKSAARPKKAGSTKTRAKKSSIGKSLSSTFASLLKKKGLLSRLNIVRAETSRHARKPIFKRFSLKPTQAYGALGGVGAIVLVFAGLWKAQSPLEVPAPVSLAPQAQTAPQGQPQVATNSAPPANVAPVTNAPPVANTAAPANTVANSTNSAPVAAPEAARAVAAQGNSPSTQAGTSNLQSAPAVVPPAPQAPSAEQSGLELEFMKIRGHDISERISFWTEYLWKSGSAKERLADLGSGPEIPDSAPLVASKYDCTIFVETVAALARSATSKDFFSNLIAIRYKDSKPTFASRNHFPEADWIPNNVKAGIIEDITQLTANISKAEARVETKRIDRGSWLAQQMNQGKVSRSIASTTDSQWKAPVDVSITYIPLSEVDKALSIIPNGTVLNLVRKNNERRPVLITHQGFVIKQGGAVLLRHSSAGGNIRTVLLKDYLNTLQAKEGSGDWPVIGVNLNRIKG